jgi:Domain of unknown function (DUF4157)
MRNRVRRTIAKGSDNYDKTRDNRSSVQTLRDAGRSHHKPLEPTPRKLFESRFGHNFADVRVHDDHVADELSRQFNARAFTVGSDLFFRADEYAPDTMEGQQLIAHELTHVVQQSRSGQISKAERSHPNDSSETEARDAAKAVMSGQMPSVAASPSGAIACAEDDERMPHDPGGWRVGLGGSSFYVPQGAADALGSAGEDALGMIPGVSTFYGAQKLLESDDPKRTAMPTSEKVLTGLGMIPGVGSVLSAGQLGWDLGTAALRQFGASNSEAPTSSEAFNELFDDLPGLP